MKIYKGSKLNLNPFLPQRLNPDDYQKFADHIPESVIFATDDEIQAKIFACFSTCISFSIHRSSENPKTKIVIDRELNTEQKEEKVYIYTFESEEDGWKYLQESREWYSEIEQNPIDVKDYSRDELLAELRENCHIEMVKEYNEEKQIN